MLDEYTLCDSNSRKHNAYYSWPGYSDDVQPQSRKKKRPLVPVQEKDTRRSQFRNLKINIFVTPHAVRGETISTLKKPRGPTFRTPAL